MELPFEEPLLQVRNPPWLPTGAITSKLEIGAELPAGAAASSKRDAALHHLASLTQCATWLWTDGSATGDVLHVLAGALIIHADEDRTELRRPAGALCSSFRAEMLAIAMTLSSWVHVEHPCGPCAAARRRRRRGLGPRLQAPSGATG